MLPLTPEPSKFWATVKWSRSRVRLLVDKFIELEKALGEGKLTIIDVFLKKYLLAAPPPFSVAPSISLLYEPSLTLEAFLQLVALLDPQMPTSTEPGSMGSIRLVLIYKIFANSNGVWDEQSYNLFQAHVSATTQFCETKQELSVYTAAWCSSSIPKPLHFEVLIKTHCEGANTLTFDDLTRLINVQAIRGSSQILRAVFTKVGSRRQMPSVSTKLKNSLNEPVQEQFVSTPATAVCSIVPTPQTPLPRRSEALRTNKNVVEEQSTTDSLKEDSTPAIGVDETTKYKSLIRGFLIKEFANEIANARSIGKERIEIGMAESEVLSRLSLLLRNEENLPSVVSEVLDITNLDKGSLLTLYACFDTYGKLFDNCKPGGVKRIKQAMLEPALFVRYFEMYLTHESATDDWNSQIED